jgi:hypothetical protein
VRSLGLLLVFASLASAGLSADIKRAFRPDDPTERIERLAIARTHVAAADEKLRNQGARELEKALKKERHPRVKNASYDLLLALRTDRALDRLVAGVMDRDSKVREHVHGIVRDHADPRLFAAIVRALEEDESWRFRSSLVDLLVSGSRQRAKAVLLRMLTDKHPAVVARAAEGLERMTGQPLGVDAEKWREYFAAVAARQPDKYKRTGETVTVADAHRKVKEYTGPIRGLRPRLYTVPILRKQVIFVVDMSGSMKKGNRSTHLTKLKEAIYGIPSDCRFNVLCFDQRLFFYAKAKSLVPATTTNKDDLARWIDALPAGQHTDVNKSVTTGLAMLNEALSKNDKSRAELFILTDGRETRTTTSLRMVEAQYNRLPKGRCAIHIVALGKHGTPSLRALARASGGAFAEVER